jgi:hypothetical protein
VKRYHQWLAAETTVRGTRVRAFEWLHPIDPLAIDLLPIQPLPICPPPIEE